MERSVVTTTETFAYNLQGWLTEQTSSRFTMALDYFDAQRYAGNITKWSWGHGLSTTHYYSLHYDQFDRLTGGYHSSGEFNEVIGSYSLNGNIINLWRTDFGSLSDDFSYTYTGNQLTRLSADGTLYWYFTYDANGNMANDPRKGLQFAYNSLNLLHQVRAGSAVQVNYLYGADGTKLQVRDGTGTSGYDYLGSLTLVKTGTITTPEVAFSEGIIRGSEVTYFEMDHLGSVRVTANASGTVTGWNDYYPFGKRHPGGQIDQNNRYLFNGKENQVTGNLGLLDFNTRMYDQEILRFHNLDVLTEDFPHQSSFVYADNNPVLFIDFMGMSAQSPDSLTMIEMESVEVVTQRTPHRWEYNIPMWGSSLLMGQAWNGGNYWDAAGWFFMGVAEGLSFGTLTLEVQSYKAAAIGATRTTATRAGTNAAKVPVGRSGNVMRSVARNTPRIIDGTKFTGHALDQMQARGIISPTAVLDVIKNPAQRLPGTQIGTTVFIKDNLKVVTNYAGDVITVIWQ